MTALRHRLRFWVTIWLVFQVVSLSALVPRDCCAAHRIATTEEKNCHEESAPVPEHPAGAHCPMPGANGEPCPMHGSGHGNHQPPRDGCTMQGTCDGPMAAFLNIISNHGVLTDLPSLALDLTGSEAPAALQENAVSRFTPPDAPPPRA
jgi:hypothetical protein